MGMIYDGIMGARFYESAALEFLTITPLVCRRMFGFLNKGLIRAVEAVAV